MGQTLTHGIYLPDEGERNCYNGLAGNWQLLDGAVGTVAEHTTQIAGKAPAVHTHTKADITDLFNSANTWSESQTYSKTVISNAAEVLHCKNANVALGETPASDYQKLFMFKDKNNDNFGYYRHLYQTTGSSQFDILVRNKFTNGAPDTSGSIDYLSFSLRLRADKSKEGVLMGSFKPSNTNTYDLGSSSYQWNNLYAKNYYYNGVAWGLDKANTWTGSNVFNVGPTIYGYPNIRNSNMEQGTVPQNTLYNGIFFSDKNNNLIGSFDYVYGTSGTAQFDIRLSRNNANAGREVLFSMSLPQSGNGDITLAGNVKPKSNNTYDLGTSTNKWKSLNGVNPGALSLPDYSKSMNVDTTGWSTSAGRISYTPTVNGWLQIAIPNDIDNNNEKSNFITIVDTDVPNDGFNNPSGISVGNTNDYRIQITFPVVANKTYYIYIKSYSGNILAVKYIAALGHI